MSLESHVEGGAGVVVKVPAQAMEAVGGAQGRCWLLRLLQGLQALNLRGPAGGQQGWGH